MNKTKKKSGIFGGIIIFIILCGTIWMIIENQREKNIIAKEEIVEQQVVKTEENKEEKEYPKANIIKTYSGYKVSAKLEIPAIDLETYVLENYSTNALNASVTKFWGADANKEGNFCIAGHNFLRKNMFHNLKKLQKGDNLYISDNNIGKVEYEIYEIYKVNPKDTSCLSQDTDGRKEVTLITCTNDSKKRIIVKARETQK